MIQDVMVHVVKMKLRDKLFYTWSMCIMWPMLYDDSTMTNKRAIDIIKKYVKDIWTNKLEMR